MLETVVSFWRYVVKNKPLKSKITGKRAYPIFKKLLENHSAEDIMKVIAVLPANSEIEPFELLNERKFNELLQEYHTEQLTRGEVMDGFNFDFFGVFFAIIRDYILPYKEQLESRQIDYLSVLLKIPRLDIERGDGLKWWLATDPILQKASRYRLISDEDRAYFRKTLKNYNKKKKDYHKAQHARQLLLSAVVWLNNIIEENFEVMEEYLKTEGIIE